jgi:iron(III) transport system substrate-binding protein
MAPLLDRFSRETGASLVVRYGDTAQLRDRLLAEGTRTPAGVFIAQEAAALGALSRKGLLRELPMDLVQLVQPRFAGNEAKHDWAGLSARARVVVYDPAVTPPEQLPRSLDELTDARYKGRFGLAPANDSFQAQLALYLVENGDKGLAQLLAGLRANQPRLYPNNAALVQAVARGEVPFGLVNHYSARRPLPQVAPGKVAIFFMPAADASSFVNAAGIGVLADDPRALELVRFLLAREPQRQVAELTDEYPLARGMGPRPGLPPLASLHTPVYDFADLAAVHQDAEGAMRRAGLLSGGSTVAPPPPATAKVSKKTKGRPSTARHGKPKPKHARKPPPKKRRHQRHPP